MADIITDDNIEYQHDILHLITLASEVATIIEKTRVSHPFAQRGLSLSLSTARRLVGDLKAAQTWLPEAESEVSE